jgi:hypothetical protein
MTNKKDPTICKKCGHNLGRSKCKPNDQGGWAVRCNKCKSVYDVKAVFPEDKYHGTKVPIKQVIDELGDPATWSKDYQPYHLPKRALTDEQKEECIKQILEVWKANPLQRLGQLLDNALVTYQQAQGHQPGQGVSMFHIEDYILLQAVIDFGAKISILK